MAYKRTKFDIVRLHVFGVILTYIVTDLLLKDLLIPGFLAGIMLGLFMKFEGSLLDGPKPPKEAGKK